MFGLFAGITFWFPKMFGRMLNNSLGRVHFWITVIGFNIAFFPMHIIGVGGHMRRIYNPLQYDFLKDLEPINVAITLGALMLGIGQIIFAVNIFGSLWNLNMKWFRATAKIVASYLTAFVTYKFVTYYLEGLTNPS